MNEYTGDKVPEVDDAFAVLPLVDIALRAWGVTLDLSILTSPRRVILRGELRNKQGQTCGLFRLTEEEFRAMVRSNSGDVASALVALIGLELLFRSSPSLLN